MPISPQPPRNRPPFQPQPSGAYQPPKKQGTGKFVWYLLLLAGGAFGYAMIHFDESPQQVFGRVVNFIESSNQPAPVPTPTPKPIARLATKPSPTPSSTPDVAPIPKSGVASIAKPVVTPIATPEPITTPVSTPAQADPITWLLKNKNQCPKEVTLRQPMQFPVMVNGGTAGSVLVKAGSGVEVVNIEPEFLTARFQGGTLRVPLSATDLRERAKVAMANPKPEPEPLQANAQQTTPAQQINAPTMPAWFKKAQQGGTAPEESRKVTSKAPASFSHPGCLSTKADLERMAAMVKAGKQPWKGSWDKLVGNTDRMLKDSPGAEQAIRVGGRTKENYIRLARDCAKAYQLALRYHGSGEKKFADKAVQIMNAWAAVHNAWDGDSNTALRRGLYGYQFACAGELLRDYEGWEKSDFKAFQNYMREQFYTGNKWFLEHLFGRYITHYWANWTLANMDSMLAIGVLCDDKEIFEEALNHFYNGKHTGGIDQTVPFVHPNGLGQYQESGRDQGHTTMGPPLMGVFCEIAWNQGIDLYGYKDNRVLAAVEYISKYNLNEEVPWVAYVYKHNNPWGYAEWQQQKVSDSARGIKRAGWDLIYNHYVNRRGLAAPWTEAYAKNTSPEGGGFNYGGASGGFDSLGFTTLTHSRVPISMGVPPSSLRPVVEGRKITLSWAGTADATGYFIKRSESTGGPYRTIGKSKREDLFYVDTNLTPGTTYHYVVSADTPKGERTSSKEAAATATNQLFGEVIGSEEATDTKNNPTGLKNNAFDGYLDNYFDGKDSQAWVGLDLGAAGAAITEVKYCPRFRQAKRMVGGKFQGSSSADFTTGVEDLFQITKEPSEGELTQQRVNSVMKFRYVRYIGPEGSHGNVGEIQFFGK